jgi:hypothetical protein
MALLLKEDEAPNPANVGLFGGIAVILRAKYGAYLLKRFLGSFSHGMAPAWAGYGALIRRNWSMYFAGLIDNKPCSGSNRSMSTI